MLNGIGSGKEESLHPTEKTGARKEVRERLIMKIKEA
jgi:hypothetical protein